MRVYNWFKGLTLELEMLHGAANIDRQPNTFYARAILYEPNTNIRHYQKLIVISFEEEDKLDI